jgi:glycopeptide antibiotics resistance protein
VVSDQRAAVSSQQSAVSDQRSAISGQLSVFSNLYITQSIIMHTKYLRFIFFSYLTALFILAILPLNGSSESALVDVFVVNIRLDYLLHSTLFLPWIFLYLLNFRVAGLFDKCIMVGAGLLMAFATEGVQFFLTYRSYNINDLLANWLGVLSGSFILLTNIPYTVNTFLKKEKVKL